ncbi:hypothetical protein BJF79_13790 [Actinomadura sp. CNU-125]|uniref:hypothetical protein n=1 Tax=Actinomadura sp. CNU-125 TaxID=1904961 RepID=UPI00095DBE2C|nr:hypothetical protein [Actinomadura sp. CNU-125]OLT24409.1 hypothetical protein BJF79_13790 [Actinomadura sp. CNU-125]
MSDGRSLPPPGTATELYLAAVYDRLGELLARFPQQPEPPGPPTGQVELREPAAVRSGAAVRSPAGEGPGVTTPGRPARSRRKTTTRKTTQQTTVGEGDE